VQKPSIQVSPDPPAFDDLDSLTDLEPLGPGAERSCVLQMQCDGHMGKNDCVSLYIVIVYRDIFGKRRTTSMGYSAIDADNIARQNAFPKRNVTT